MALRAACSGILNTRSHTHHHHYHCPRRHHYYHPPLRLMESVNWSWHSARFLPQLFSISPLIVECCFLILVGARHGRALALCTLSVTRPSSPVFRWARSQRINSSLHCTSQLAATLLGRQRLLSHFFYGFAQGSPGDGTSLEKKEGEVHGQPTNLPLTYTKNSRRCDFHDDLSFPSPTMTAYAMYQEFVGFCSHGTAFSQNGKPVLPVAPVRQYWDANTEASVASQKIIREQ